MSAPTPVRPLPSPLVAGDRHANYPPALALCWHCGAEAHRIDPPGWVTVNLSREPEVEYTHGVCPACLAGRYARCADPSEPPPTADWSNRPC